MLKLNLQKQPYWMELAPGVRVHVRPITTAIMSAAQAYAYRKIVELRDLRAKLQEEGKSVAELPDVNDEQTRTGLSKAFLTKGLARGAIFEWEGVLQPDSDVLAPVIDQTIDDFIDIWFIGDKFWDRYTDHLSMLEKEGNGLRPVANGTSAAGRNIANPVRKRSFPAAKGKQAP